MTALPLYDIEDTLELLVDGTVLIDVRAPIEFTAGSLPGARNLPILNDDQRRLIGTTYKQSGREEAIQLGLSLFSGPLKAERIDGWLEVLDEHPKAALYCARGGLRSKFACEWIDEAGKVLPRIEGGFKRIRGYLLQSLEQPPEAIVLSGCTGVGKTETIKQVAASIDLEGLANHRGSGFGRRIGGQPTQVDFENRLAVAFLRAERAGHQRLLLEDESRRIGRIGLPPAVYSALKTSRIILQTAPLDARIQLIQREYAIEALEECEAAEWSLLEIQEKRDGLPARLRETPNPFIMFAAELLRSLDSIQRRLGGLRHRELRDLMEDALVQHAQGDPARHCDWIRSLLEVYYDPMYTYQIQNKRDRIVFEGDSPSCIEWFRTSALSK